jgi:glutaminyl-peptide cyclotransferase
MLAALLAGIAVLSVAAVGGGEEPSARPASAARAVDRFDGDRAWNELVRQVELGPRPAGSATLRALGRALRDRLPRGRLERVDGHPGLRNVVGRIPGSKPAVLIGAHYDTKDQPGFVGANDGAGGTAAVLELARVLRAVDRPAGAPELRFVLFDGEESPDDSAPFYTSGLRGSRAYAREHAGELRAVVLLDFVADRDLAIPREATSNRRLWRHLRAAAKRVGSARHFPAGTGPTLYDDHTPFLRRGVPSIDLIDFDFPCWHKTCDDLEHVSKRSLDRAGEAVLDLALHWPR